VHPDDLLIRLCHPDEEEVCWNIEQACWAPFNWEADGAEGVGYFPALHVVAQNSAGDLVATVDACPVHWDGDPGSLPDGGWTDVVLAAQQGFDEPPAFACALGASILPAARGAGISRRLLIGLRDAAKRAGYLGLLAPVRPTARLHMPHLPIAEYERTRLPDGRHFDPWVRTHEAVGGKIIGSCHASAVFQGSRPDWERWTGMRLPDNGRVLAPHTAGWLDLVDGWGVLTESSLWLLHDLVTGPGADLPAGPFQPADHQLADPANPDRNDRPVEAVAPLAAT
jgi:GNAT superfamily N-acetyltransferase